MSGPVASNLVLLGDLERCAPGTKVRFLGCVEQYVIKTGTLRLKHDFSASSASIVAHVDIEHVRERVKRNELELGTWINVIGYVEHRPGKGVFVQAVAIWDAGNVDLNVYEKAVEKRKEMG